MVFEWCGDEKQITLNIPDIGVLAVIDYDAVIGCDWGCHWSVVVYDGSTLVAPRRVFDELEAAKRWAESEIVSWLRVLIGVQQDVIARLLLLPGLDAAYAEWDRLYAAVRAETDDARKQELVHQALEIGRVYSLDPTGRPGLVTGSWRRHER
jgi:hypothetical protein